MRIADKLPLVPICYQDRQAKPVHKLIHLEFEKKYKNKNPLRLPEFQSKGGFNSISSLDK